MPDEFSPAHNIVCWGSSVWHRSVEEKLWLITNQSDQSNCQGGLHTMLDRSPVRSSRAGPRAGLPGRGAPGPRTGDTGGSYLAPGRSAACVAAGSTHIWRHSELFSPVNTNTSERASAAVVTYYVALIGCRSIQLS